MYLFLESAAGTTAAGSSASMILMFVVLIAVFYFFMIRPENKRKKEAQQMRDSLKVGDNITTIGGIIGDVVSVKEDSIVVETSADRVRVEFAKFAVSSNNTAEKEAANKLINNGCVLISQHADSMGAPTACENAGVPNVSYNGSTVAACPKTFLISSRINWAPYYEYAITAVVNGETIDADWTGTLETGSVVLTDLNEGVVAEGTQEAIDAAKAELEAGTRQVFDVTTFTVDGQQIDSYQADVDTDANYTPDTEVVENGAFQESKFRSAPYFDLRIDGITLLDEAYG